MTISRKSQKQGQDIVIGKKYSVHSKVLREARPYWVYLPASYNKDNKERHYPVLYLLDANAHFQAVAGVINFMGSGTNGNYQIPELIVVGIPNTHRIRDLSPTHSTLGYDGNEDVFLESSGGGYTFLQFIQDELFPQIDAEFNTLPFRILVGHSLGGLLALHALLEKPSMFHAYIASDPSLWWDNEYLNHIAEAKIGIIRKLSKTVYISASNTPDPPPDDQSIMRRAIQKHARIMDTAKTVHFRHFFHYFDSEVHSSVLLLSLYHGLLFIFDGFKPIDFETLSAMNTRFRRLSKRLEIELVPNESYVNRLGYTMLYEMHDVKKAIAFLNITSLNFQIPRTCMIV